MGCGEGGDGVRRSRRSRVKEAFLGGEPAVSNIWGKFMFFSTKTNSLRSSERRVLFFLDRSWFSSVTRRISVWNLEKKRR